MKKNSFWGSYILICGLIWITSIIFDLHWPLFSLFLSTLLILLGLHILFRQKRRYEEASSCTEKGNFERESSTRKQILFETEQLDLSSWATTSSNDSYDLKVIFGESVCWIDPHYTWHIKSSTAFGQTRFPDNSSLSFGDQLYIAHGQTENAETKKLKTECVFAKLEIRFKTTPEDPQIDDDLTQS